jgi:hypothetical protein
MHDISTGPAVCALDHLRLLPLGGLVAGDSCIVFQEFSQRWSTPSPEKSSYRHVGFVRFQLTIIPFRRSWPTTSLRVNGAVISPGASDQRNREKIYFQATFQQVLLLLPKYSTRDFLPLSS